jgi:class 3 adenylate cyclase
LTCALGVQRAIVGGEGQGRVGVQVRIALYTGEADPDSVDWRGTAVNCCAQIRALAHGGQVLVSGAVRELVGDDLPPEAALRDLGRHRLRKLVS